MLPFLKKSSHNQVGGIVTKYMSADGETSNKPGDKDMDGPEAAAREIISAIESKDHSKLAEALHALFQMFDAAPHVEGPHEAE